MSRTSIAEYEIIDHGTEHAQYFVGCSTNGTSYTASYTGYGRTPQEALEDVLDQLSMDEYETDTITDTLSKKSQLPDDLPENNELHHYVSIRLR